MKVLPIKRDLKEENRIQDSRVINPEDGKKVLISMYEQNDEIVITDAYDSTKIYQNSLEVIW